MSIVESTGSLSQPPVEYARTGRRNTSQPSASRRRAKLPWSTAGRSEWGEFSDQLDQSCTRTQLGQEVQDALLNLPYEFREAVVLCDVVGLSYDEIASTVTVPVGTIRSRIHRGRKMLREELS